jgi:hypothetical protein
MRSSRFVAHDSTTWKRSNTDCRVEILEDPPLKVEEEARAIKLEHSEGIFIGQKPTIEVETDLLKLMQKNNLHPIASRNQQLKLQNEM